MIIKPFYFQHFDYMKATGTPDRICNFPLMHFTDAVRKQALYVIEGAPTQIATFQGIIIF